MEKGQHCQLSQEVQEGILSFIQDVDLLHISQSLRTVFFDYLRHQSDGWPTELEQILNDIECLFNLVEILSNEKANNHVFKCVEK